MRVRRKERVSQPHSVVYEMVNAPPASEYVRALTAIASKVTPPHRQVFQAHCDAPDRQATAKELAVWASIKGGHPRVNSMYGRLGHSLSDEFGIEPTLRPNDKFRWWSVWSRGWQSSRGFVWEMLPQVADALTALGWVHSKAVHFPDEVDDGALVEGAVTRVTVNAFERNRRARQQCLAKHGDRCSACDFAFGDVYGAEFAGYIHVHHLRPIAEVGESYVVDPESDLVPVCPNCHAAIHYGGRTRTIDEVRNALKSMAGPSISSDQT